MKNKMTWEKYKKIPINKVHLVPRNVAIDAIIEGVRKFEHCLGKDCVEKTVVELNKSKRK